jgi:hypothetical protein
MVSLVRNTVSNTLRATGAVTGESIHLVRDVVKGAVQATDKIALLREFSGHLVQ